MSRYVFNEFIGKYRNGSKVTFIWATDNYYGFNSNSNGKSYLNLTRNDEWVNIEVLKVLGYQRIQSIGYLSKDPSTGRTFVDTKYPQITLLVNWSSMHRCEVDLHNILAYFGTSVDQLGAVQPLKRDFNEILSFLE